MIRQLTRGDTWYLFIASWVISLWSVWGTEMPEGVLPENESTVLLLAFSLQVIFMMCVIGFYLKVLSPWVQAFLKSGKKDDS